MPQWAWVVRHGASRATGACAGRSETTWSSFVRPTNDKAVGGSRTHCRPSAFTQVFASNCLSSRPRDAFLVSNSFPTCSMHVTWVLHAVLSRHFFAPARRRVHDKLSDRYGGNSGRHCFVGSEDEEALAVLMGRQPKTWNGAGRSSD